MLTRRELIVLGGSTFLLFAPAGARAADAPLAARPFSEAEYQTLPVLGLATSLVGEHDYPAEIVGRIPAALEGTLYRNGPGLFERGGCRKRCLLDGDGMVQAFQFHAGGARYRNRFVRTEKYREEATAGRYLYATWSTQAPGGVLANLGGAEVKNQAGISVLVRDGRLFAFDEFKPPYELDPETLETFGETWLGQPPESTVFAAHSKLDRRNGDWIFFGLAYGARPRLHLTVLAADGTLKKHQEHPLPGQTYLHDFFVSDRHILVHLHPVELSVFPIMAGLSSIVGAMRWLPEQGSRVLVFDRAGDGPPRIFESEASWMWHSVNAWEDGGEIVADFVGYRHPDHFLGEDPALFAIMEGRWGNYRYPGELRRFVIDLAAGRLRQEILSTDNHDFPTVHPAHLCHRHHFGYFARISPGALFFDEVARIDLRSGRTAAWRFAPGCYCSEPLFAPLPGRVYAPNDREEPGWLLTEVYDSAVRRSLLAVFRAEDLAAGPLAEVRMYHHAPLGFHGFWQPAQAGR